MNATVADSTTSLWLSLARHGPRSSTVCPTNASQVTVRAYFGFLLSGAILRPPGVLLASSPPLPKLNMAPPGAGLPGALAGAPKKDGAAAPGVDDIAPNAKGAGALGAGDPKPNAGAGAPPNMGGAAAGVPKEKDGVAAGCPKNPLPPAAGAPKGEGEAPKGDGAGAPKEGADVVWAIAGAEPNMLVAGAEGAAPNVKGATLGELEDDAGLEPKEGAAPNVKGAGPLDAAGVVAPKVKDPPGAGECAGEGEADPNPNGEAVPDGAKSEAPAAAPNAGFAAGFSPNPANDPLNAGAAAAAAGAPNVKDVADAGGGSVAVLGAEWSSIPLSSSGSSIAGAAPKLKAGVSGLAAGAKRGAGAAEDAEEGALNAKGDGFAAFGASTGAPNANGAGAGTTGADGGAPKAKGAGGAFCSSSAMKVRDARRTSAGFPKRPFVVRTGAGAVGAPNALNGLGRSALATLATGAGAGAPNENAGGGTTTGGDGAARAAPKNEGLVVVSTLTAAGAGVTGLLKKSGAVAVVLEGATAKGLGVGAGVGTSAGTGGAGRARSDF